MTASAASYRPQSGDRRQGFLLWFLAIALLLHAALLLIPAYKPNSPAAGPTAVEIRLVHEPPPALPATIKIPKPVPVLQPKVTGPDQSGTPPPTVTEHTEPEPTTVVTTARLLDIVSNLEWKEREDRPTRIARSVSSEFYTNMIKPILALEFNLFDEWILPVKTEIMDRWLDPAGVHRVVIRVPTGQTLCGRQEPVDPFRPWTQMPMMFYECAGGGKRKASRKPGSRNPP